MTATLEDRANTLYITKLTDEANAAALRAGELSEAFFLHYADMSPGQRLSLMEAADAHARKRDSYRQQVDFYLHRTNTPAWRD